MPEFRQNIATREWVIIATERAKRPDQFVRRKKERKVLAAFMENCPFCPGNEDQTPAPSLVIGDERQWDVRVVPNKYAALRADDSNERERSGLFLKAGGYGIAEVIIETPRHDLCIATMPESNVRQVLEAYRQRKTEVAQMHNINFVTLFRNHGERVSTMVHIALALGYSGHVGALQGVFGTPQENGLLDLGAELEAARAALADAPEDAALQAEVDRLEQELAARTASVKPGEGPKDGWELVDLDVNGDGVVDRQDLEAARASTGEDPPLEPDAT